MNFIEILSILFFIDKVFVFFIVLLIVRNSKSLNKDIPWIVFILLCPFIGSLIYLFLGSDRIKDRLLIDISKSIEESKKYLIQDKEVKKKILKRGNDLIFYLSEYCNFPTTRRNRVEYYSSGESFFESVKLELKGAKKFIFMEFFTIELGTLWEEILDILKEKVRIGVEVRIIYDNIVCHKKIPSKYYNELESLGIQCVPFYKNRLLVGMIRNHHEHRKCVIVDGRIVFTGGMNIEDKYVNLEQPYGHWKDVGISVCGEGVWSFTVMFLSMWSALLNNQEDYTRYRMDLFDEVKDSGYVVPFGDNPLDQETVAKNTYIQMIYQAKKCISVFTPYLILDMDIQNALSLAGKRGVDVRIIIPGIPDKRLVYQVSLLNARKLMKDNVKVYTYTPGFLHGKVLLVDDKVATVSTMNLDYRSFYFDFEYGVLIEDINTIWDIKKDVEDTLQNCVEVKSVKFNFLRFLWEGILLLFAPLM